jgi:hypothetical protein
MLLSIHDPSGTLLLTKWLTSNQVVKQEKNMMFDGRRHCIPSQYCAPLVKRPPADRNTGAVPLFFGFANQVVS